MRRIPFLIFFVLIMIALLACREQKGETPQENYEMNRGEDAPEGISNDTLTKNPTQTDPGATR
jgi:hypothetical protein